MMTLFRRTNNETLNMDAWSDGQVGSKLWLCRKLEAVLEEKKLPQESLWFFGSWYGTLPHMLLTRERIQAKKILCFDLDKRANKIAAKILDHWHHAGVKIEIFNKDCNQIKEEYQIEKPSILINTSCEHMQNYDWWENIPSETTFAIQSTNMEHPTHINKVETLQDFKQKISPAEIYLEDEKEFKYPNLQFKRFMLIGRKL